MREPKSVLEIKTKARCNSRSNHEYMCDQGEDDQWSLSFACFASLHETDGMKTRAAAF